MREHVLDAALAAFAPGRRGVCPSRADLVSYFDSALGADAQAAIRLHVAACPFCAADLADLNALATPPLFAAVVALVKEGLRLVAHSFQASDAPVPAPARGAASPTLELAAEGEGLGLTVRLGRAAAGAADVRVQVARAAGPGRARVNLLRGGDLLESRLTSEGDEVLFSAVTPGEYHLSVAPPEGDEAARVALTLTAEAS
jgi:hypothetical protein